MADTLDRLVATIDDLTAVDPDALTEAELHEHVVELQRQATRLDSVCTRAVGAWDARKAWADNGAKSAAARLARETKLAPHSARGVVRRARKLRTMPHTAAAFAAGEVSADQVDLLARANQPRVAEAFAGDEAELVRDATLLDYRWLERVVRYWQHHADPDGTTDSARRQDEDRQVHASRTFAGTVELQGTLVPVGGGIFTGELARLEQQLFEADWADARQRCGEHATVEDLARTPAQRRHDALVEMARRSAAMPPGATMARPLISVLVGYETFAGAICETGDGTVIAPQSILPLLTEADIERIVFDGPSRVIDVGRRSRFFTEAQRRAVIARDLHCQHPAGCDVPAEVRDRPHQRVDRRRSHRPRQRPRHVPPRQPPTPRPHLGDASPAGLLEGDRAEPNARGHARGRSAATVRRRVLVRTLRRTGESRTVVLDAARRGEVRGGMGSRRRRTARS